MTNEPPPYSPPNFERPSQDETEVRARHESNRAGWNEGALHYAATLDEAFEFLRAGKSNLHPVERSNLGDLRSWCKNAIHLQCASGRDTISLWNEGVERVVGVDISDVHIENARLLTARLREAGLPVQAEWYRCDVLDTPSELDGTADLVYTGRGALCWLHDLNAYAQVVARLLKPGGVYSVLDGHPVTYLFDIEAEDYIYSGASYFGHAESSKGWPETYIGESLGIPVEQQANKYERWWNLAEIHAALTQAGLVVKYLGEHPEDFWDSFHRLRPELKGRIPLTFSMLARKK